MILKSRNFSNWMSYLPDEVAISELTIPGSHVSKDLKQKPHKLDKKNTSTDLYVNWFVTNFKLESISKAVRYTDGQSHDVKLDH
jgi:hypothetical protein